jgi:hypothetical protein
MIYYAPFNVERFRLDRVDTDRFDTYVPNTLYYYIINHNLTCYQEELGGPAISALGVRSRKLSNVLNGKS